MVGTIDGKTREMVASLYGPEPVADEAETPSAPEPVATAEKRDLSLDRPNVRAVVSMEVRMSGVDQCMRRLAYEAKEVEPSDEIPTRNRALMEMGKHLEPLVKRLMQEDGWDVSDEDAVELPHGRIILTGHPDGVASHPVKTAGLPAVIEVKTRSESMAEYAWQVGVERTHPDAVSQAALYSMALFGEVRDIVVVTLARDSGDYKAERIPADRARAAFDRAMKRVTEIGRMVLRGEIPEPELPQGDAKCQSCPYRSLCGNAEIPENPRRRRPHRRGARGAAEVVDRRQLQRSEVEFSRVEGEEGSFGDDQGAPGLDGRTRRGDGDRREGMEPEGFGEAGGQHRHGRLQRACRARGA